jgi:putative PIN family toxin of toxin-antitoxin system
MKCLIDTNILVSAALFPNSVPAQAYMKAAVPPCRAVVCCSMDELRRVFNEKFPHRIQDYERFVAALLFSVEIISTPTDEERRESENQIRDINDRLILRASIAANVDILISGDRDFLESGVTSPKIVKAADFLRMAGIVQINLPTAGF